jgi:hypothetical protein
MLSFVLILLVSAPSSSDRHKNGVGQGSRQKDSPRAIPKHQRLYPAEAGDTYSNTTVFSKTAARERGEVETAVSRSFLPRPHPTPGLFEGSFPDIAADLMLRTARGRARIAAGTSTNGRAGKEIQQHVTTDRYGSNETRSDTARSMTHDARSDA